MQSKTVSSRRWRHLWAMTLVTGLLLAALLLSACTPAAPTAPPAESAGEAAAEPAAEPADAAMEAPMLAEMVAAGTLPALADRLPVNPKVVQPTESLGEYGGVWRMGLRGGQDNALLNRTLAYEHLVRWTPDWSAIEPNVAESFEASPDATEFTFKLREGMKWSDGEPFTVDDVLFWYEDILTNEEYQAVHPVPSWLLAGGEPPVVEKIDDLTFKVKFAAPNGLFIQNMATPSGDDFTRWPKHYAMQFHPKYNAENLDALIAEANATDWVNLMDLKAGGVPGTPYDARWQNSELPTLKPWRLTLAYGEGTTQVVAERNPFYFKVDPEGRQLPYIDKLIYEIGEDVQVLTLKALNGEIDMQDRHIATLDNKAVFVDNAETGGYGFFETVPSSMNTQVIALNLNHKNPVMREIFQNKDFRIGLSYAINRQELIDTIYVGQGEPWQLAPRPTSPFYNEQLAKQYTEYDVDKANEYLDKAGYTERDAEGYRLGPDGKRISFLVDVQAISQPWIDALELIKTYWAEVGIQMEPNVMDRSLMYTRKDSNEHDAVTWGGDGGLDVILEPRWYFPFSGESLYAEAWKEWFVNPGGVGSLTPPEEPPAGPKQQMDLYNQIKASGDAAQQEALMKEILQIAADEFYALGISLPAPGYGIVRNNFKNVPASFPSAWLYPHPAPTNPEQYYISQ